MPPVFARDVGRHNASETFEEGEEMEREFGASLTVRCRTEPQARQMGQMAAGGVAVQNLQQEYLHGGDRREHTVAPRRIPDLATHRENGVRLQPRGPLACKPLQDGGDTRDHGGTSWTIGGLMPIHT